MIEFTKRAAFLWLWSFLCAYAGYWVLWLIMPWNYVYGQLFRMHYYHVLHPVAFMLIPCFFYGIIGAFTLDFFARSDVPRRVALVLLISVATVLVSSPVGGSLWHFFDMVYGWWPGNYYLTKLFVRGPVEGLQAGWLIVALSVPYNLLGVVACYFITNAAAKRFVLKQQVVTDHKPTAEESCRQANSK